MQWLFLLDSFWLSVADSIWSFLSDSIWLFQPDSNTNPINQTNKGKGTKRARDSSRDAPAVIDDAEIGRLKQQIKDNIGYKYLIQRSDCDREILDEIYKTICDIVCVPRESVKISGADYPYCMVRERFLELNDMNIGYVMSCMEQTTSDIRNIKAYLLTALYNAPTTENHYYQQMVQHDMATGTIRKSANN